MKRDPLAFMAALVIVTWLLIVVGWTVILTASNAHGAEPRPSVVAVMGNDCVNKRPVSVYYAHHWQTINLATIYNSPLTFHEHSCHVAVPGHPLGFRLFKSTANTRAEAAFQRHFLATDHPQQPTVFCRQSPDHAYFLDLAFYWGAYGADHLGVAERTLYTAWTHRYARAHGCRTYNPTHHRSTASKESFK